MKPLRFTIVFALLLVLLGHVRAQQQLGPHIGYVYPAGGKQGSTFEVTVGGQQLADTSSVFVSGTGVEARVIECTKPFTQKTREAMRTRMEALRKMPKTPEVVREMSGLVKQLEVEKRRRDQPALADHAVLEVTIAPDAEVGERELRIQGRAGVSNPMVFCVGQLPEYSKKSEVSSPDTRDLQDLRRRNQPVATAPTPDFNITLPSVVNGQIRPGGRDRYRFTAKAHQRVTVLTAARSLIPYLADAVPGWFQATVALYDAKGHELAYSDDYRFDPDPVLLCDIPADGEYVLEIKDAIYRGRADFVYRISIGELPFVTSIFPLGATPGSRTAVKVQGWNVATNKLTVAANPDESGVRRIELQEKGQFSNAMPFVVDPMHDALEQEPNDQNGKAQAIKLPVIINGRIESAKDVDTFRFEGNAGDVVVAEVEARRLDSPLDSWLRLTDAKGGQIAFNDDFEDKGSGLHTHHADSYITGTLPAKGTYYVQLGDSQHQGGAAYGYRLRVSPPRPDFELRAVPSTLNVRGGGSAAVTIYALRRDGFPGEVAMRIKDAPKGVKLSGSSLPANAEKVTLTVTVPPDAPDEPFPILLEGVAKLQEKELVHPVVPADDMMQAFAYRHLVPAKELLVSVGDRFKGRAAAKILSPTPVKIAPGGTAKVHIGVPAQGLLRRVQLQLSEPPDGITMRDVSLVPDGAEIVIEADASAVEPGQKGNLIVSAVLTPMASGTVKSPRAGRQIQVGTMPAIPYEIAAAQEQAPAK